MNKRDYIIILFDYYECLLNEDNKAYFKDYYFENLSLGEIAENKNVSRNAVHKHIKSVEGKLLFYEEKLKLYEKDKELRKVLDKIKDQNLKKEIEKIYS